LLAVRGQPGHPTVGELAELLVLKHHSVVELVDRLERRRLLARTRSTHDRRVAHVSITSRGHAVLEKLSRQHQAELRRAGPGLIGALEAVMARPRRRQS
jgi:DNA-binding MarR family transcriptional regulator